jgi:hypothetical protein
LPPSKKIGSAGADFSSPMRTVPAAHGQPSDLEDRDRALGAVGDQGQLDRPD